MRPRLDLPADPRLLEVILEAYARVARATLAGEALAGEGLPPLYQSGVRYQREPPGSERWQLPDETYRRRRGDCEDLSVWRAAELQLAGVDARPVVYRTGPRQLHVIVQTPGGYEDPSRVLGMGRQRR